jgi:hypothetical protein
MAPKSERPHMDPRLAERIKRKKAQLDAHARGLATRFIAQ